MGTTAAREAARERIVREAASGNGRAGAGGSMRGNSTWDGGSEASDGRNDGDDGGNEEGVGYRRSLLQRWGVGR